METRTIVLYGGGELDIDNGPNVDGLVFFRLRDRHDRELVIAEWAMDSAAAGRTITALYEAKAYADHRTAPAGQGTLVAAPALPSRGLVDVYS